MKRNGNGNGKKKPCAPVGSLHMDHCKFKRRLAVLRDLAETMAHEDMGWLPYADAATFHTATAAIQQLCKRHT